MKTTLISINLFLLINTIHGFLSIENGHFVYNKEKVFLSGVNIAWDHYARDFGSEAYDGVRADFEKYLASIEKAGGNALRLWVHVDGQWSPKFDSQGFATGTDTPSLIKELGQFLDKAAEHNVFVLLCLWNGAVKPQQMIHLFSDDKKLESYIDKVLKPLADGLKNKKALAGYDIINEPEGSITTGLNDSNPCYDTNILVGTGANWAGSNITMENVMKFLNIHSDAIKSVDPKALITVGTGERYITPLCYNCREYWSDHCLASSGGKPKGIIDFHQLHSYTWQGKFGDWSPFKKLSADYKSPKPLIVGEFSTDCSESNNSAANYKLIYNSGYSGALDWQYNEGGGCADKQSVANEGMNAIKDMTTNGKIRVKIN